MKTSDAYLLVRAAFWASALMGCGELGVMSFDGDGCEGYGIPKNSLYRLPYTVGESYEVFQGNCGAISHFGIARYAYDLKMVIGMPVLAMRAGVVTMVKMSAPDGVYSPNVNEIRILHEDGTVGIYVHMKQASAAVEVDNVVTQGQTIALSGSSGTTLPHLHIQIQSSPADNAKSIPFNFANALKNDWGLAPGKKYEAQP